MPSPKFEKGNPGRPKGSVNAIPAKIKALCLKAAPEVIAELKRLMQDKNPAIRLAACNALLDRGIGKAAQPIVGEGEGPVEVRHIISWIRDDKPEASQESS
jgi:HEAT repeat protein